MRKSKERGKARTSFPAQLVVLDASLIVRFFKCGEADLLFSLLPVGLTRAVEEEVKRRRNQKDALAQLHFKKLAADEHARIALDRIRGPSVSKRDLGEDTCLAYCASRPVQERPVFGVDDREAIRRAAEEGVVTLSFLETLGWLGVLGTPPERLDAIERNAAERNGWRRPTGYNGSIQEIQASLTSDWQRRFAGAGARGTSPAK